MEFIAGSEFFNGELLAFDWCYFCGNEWFVNIHGLIKQSFVVIDHGFCDEGKEVKDMEDDVVEGI